MTIENYNKLELCKLVENDNRIICKGSFSKLQEYILNNISKKGDNNWTIDKDWRYFIQVYRQVRHESYLRRDTFEVTSTIFAKKKDIVRLLHDKVFQDLKNSEDHALRELSDIENSFEFKVSEDEDFIRLRFSHKEYYIFQLDHSNYCGACDLRQWSVLNSYENVLKYEKDTSIPSKSYLFMDMTPIFLYKFLTADESLRIIKNAPISENKML